MSGRLIESFHRGGRRMFVAQLAAGAAGVVTGVLGFAPRLAAHEERQTLVAAGEGRQFGIVTYRIVRIGGGLHPNATQPSTTQVRAELLGPGPVTLGRFSVTLHWGKEFDQLLKKDKQQIRRKRYELQWSGDVLATEMNIEKRSVSVEYNHQRLYSGPVEDAASAIKPFFDAHAEVIALMAAVEHDLTVTYPPPQVDIQCCREVGCNGPTMYGQGTGLFENDACAAAQQSANNRCSNQYCWGCCELHPGGCNCRCAFDPFLCFCETSGTSCGCEVYVV